MTERLADAKARLLAAERQIVEKTRAAAKATDDYVNENPWQSVLVAGGVGFILGFIVHRMASSSKIMDEKPSRRANRAQTWLVDIAENVGNDACRYRVYPAGNLYY